MPYTDLLRGRWSCVSHAYLITAATDKRRPLFVDFALGAIVAKELMRMRRTGIWSVHAWVLMPDHFHVLCELRSESLARSVQRFKGRSAFGINAVRDSRASVWQRGYHDHALRKEEAIADVARYIVANPLRAGLVERLRDYPFWDAAYLS